MDGFQNSAFQTDAFQVDVYTDPGTAAVKDVVFSIRAVSAAFRETRIIAGFKTARPEKFAVTVQKAYFKIINETKVLR